MGEEEEEEEAEEEEEEEEEEAEASPGVIANANGEEDRATEDAREDDLSGIGSISDEPAKSKGESELSESAVPPEDAALSTEDVCPAKSAEIENEEEEEEEETEASPEVLANTNTEEDCATEDT